MKKHKIDIRPNPLELFEIRKVDILPLHFETTSIQVDQSVPSRPHRLILSDIEEWIKQNTFGRYYISPSISHNFEITVGLENSKELSYFILAYK